MRMVIEPTVIVNKETKIIATESHLDIFAFSCRKFTIGFIKKARTSPIINGYAVLNAKKTIKIIQQIMANTNKILNIR